LLCCLEIPFSRVLFTASKEISGVKDTEVRSGEYQFNWQLFQPAAQLGVIGVPPRSFRHALYQARRALEILGLQGVLYRLLKESILYVPLAGPDMQR
jgi:hypothetical protein